MDFLNLPGVLPAILGLFAAVAWWIRHDGIRRSNEQEARHQEEMTQMRGDQDKTNQFFKLINDQASSIRELAAAIKEQNGILMLQGKRHDDAMTLIADNNVTLIQFNERITDLITNFQAFSREQHAQTRATVADTTQEVVDVMKQSIDGGIERVQEELHTLTGEVRFVKRLIEEITPCPPEVMPKLASIETTLNTIHEQLKPTVLAVVETVPAEAKPDIAPPDTNGEPPPQTNGEVAA